MRVSTLCTLSVIKLRHQMFDNIFSTHVTHHSVQMSCKAAARLFARPYMRHATLPRVLVHFSTYVMPRRCTFSFTSPHKNHASLLFCTSTHMWCYAAARSFGASISCYIMPRCRTFSYTSPHTSCYVAARSVALFHIRHALLLYVLLRFRTHACDAAAPTSHFCTHIMLRCRAFSYTYAARWLAPLHIRHATLPHVHWHFPTYVMLRCHTFTCTSPRMSCSFAVCLFAS